MYFEDSDNCNFAEHAYSTRSHVEPLSLFDTNSRDSGFEEIDMEACTEAAFLEEFAEINLPQKSNFPTQFDTLVNGPCFNLSDSQTPTCLRSPSLKEVSAPQNIIFQRPDGEECENSFSLRTKKRVRSQINEDSSVPTDQCKLTFYSSEDIIKSAIQRSDSEPDLIGDFSRTYSLPLTNSRHQDLKAITATTLKSLLDGEFRDRVPSFTIIDCRYPYEFEGGHIPGAINVYTHEQCSTLLENVNSHEKLEKPDVLIFHCEFSAERGPNLYRHMRQEDRKKNMQLYPSLCFPEMYILEGGYRQFYGEYASMCFPPRYTQMLDPEHSSEMILFRQTSKTWDSDVKNCMRKRNLRKK